MGQAHLRWEILLTEGNQCASNFGGIFRKRRMKMDKLTEHELLKRLDNEFYDVDFQVVTSATKGVVATVQFYEDKIEED